MIYFVIELFLHLVIAVTAGQSITCRQCFFVEETCLQNWDISTQFVLEKTNVAKSNWTSQLAWVWKTYATRKKLDGATFIYHSRTLRHCPYFYTLLEILRRAVLALKCTRLWVQNRNKSRARNPSNLTKRYHGRTRLRIRWCDGSPSNFDATALW